MKKKAKKKVGLSPYLSVKPLTHTTQYIDLLI
jgi:hypothetical protein